MRANQWLTGDMTVIEIAASILSADLLRLGEEARKAAAAGAAAIQIDIMDGLFVPNLTFGPDVVGALRSVVGVGLDVHLMIQDPDRFIVPFVDAGADRLVVHQEACLHLDRTLRTIKDLDVQVGVALNPGTPLSTLEEVLELVDVIQIMTVNPGFGGQEFIQSQVAKIGRLREQLETRGSMARIAVDGGIDTMTAPQVVKAGATILVVGSSLYNHHNSVEQNVKNILASVV